MPSKSNPDEPYYISNNLPYIGVLEYGGYPNPPKKGSWSKRDQAWVIKSENGFSKQAPEGMVGLTVAKFQSIVNKIAQEEKNK